MSNCKTVLYTGIDVDVEGTKRCLVSALISKDVLNES